jgi:hypothetical protein
MNMNKHSRLSASIVVKQFLSQLFTETEYMELVYGIIIDDVIRDIEECADEEFNYSDVSLAVQRTLMKALNIEI